MTLKTEIQTDPLALGYAAFLPDCPGAIADMLNAPTRTRLTPTEVGKGDALGVLGFDVGNALLDAIDNAPNFRHVKHLLVEGRLRLDLPLTQGALASLVGVQIAAGVIFSAQHIAALNSLAMQPCSRAQELGLPAVSALDVTKAANGNN